MAATSRYTLTPKINLGTQYGTSDTISRLRSAVKNGLVNVQVIFLKEAVRLDVLAGQYFGDSRYAWIIAICSNIGWISQIPPNTRIVIPDLNQALQYLG